CDPWLLTIAVGSWKLPAITSSGKEKMAMANGDTIRESRAKILLVDDESAISDNLAAFLERAGFECAWLPMGKLACNLSPSFTPISSYPIERIWPDLARRGQWSSTSP